MKKMKILLTVFCLAFLFTGCGETAPKVTEAESLAGYIHIEGDTLYLDKVEIIERVDTDRIAELNLDPDFDLPNGYYIYNKTAESVPYELTEDTVYTFTDFELLFVDEPDSNRFYESTKLQEFLDGSSYQDVPLEEQRIPYFLFVQDGKVISIMEDFIYTM